MVDAPNGNAGDIIAGALPGILSRAQVVVSPYPFGVSDGDKLRVTVANTLAGITLEIHGRSVPRGEAAKPFRLPMAPASSGFPTTQDFPLAGGFITNLSVVAANGSPQIGQTYVIVQMIRGDGAAAFVMGTLLEGYVTATQALGWPGSPITDSITVGGYIRQIAGTKPAAGLEVFETVPNGRRWDVIAIFLRLQTSAAVGNRFTRLDFVSPVVAYFAAFNASPLLASQNGLYVAAPVSADLDVAIGGGDRWIRMPIPLNFTMRQGDSFQSNTHNLSALDQWDAPYYVVKESLEVF